MSWTTTTPTAPGLYWYHTSNGEDFIYLSEIEIDGVLGDEETGMPVSEMITGWEITHWSGPVTAPSFPS